MDEHTVVLSECSLQTSGMVGPSSIGISYLIELPVSASSNFLIFQKFLFTQTGFGIKYYTTSKFIYFAAFIVHKITPSYFLRLPSVKRKEKW